MIEVQITGYTHTRTHFLIVSGNRNFPWFAFNFSSVCLNKTHQQFATMSEKEKAMGARWPFRNDRLVTVLPNSSLGNVLE